MLRSVKSTKFKRRNVRYPSSSSRNSNRPSKVAKPVRISAQSPFSFQVNSVLTPATSKPKHCLANSPSRRKLSSSIRPTHQIQTSGQQLHRNASHKLFSICPEFQSLNKSLPDAMQISNLVQDAECAAYSGFNFKFMSRSVKFRQAKITPLKNGAFVALWKRDPVSGETIPFDTNDLYDIFVILVEKEEKRGIFVFPTQVLAEHGVLSRNSIGGKRGFRLYPAWDNPVSKLACNSQKWQTEFFLLDLDLIKFQNILHGYCKAP